MNNMNENKMDEEGMDEIEDEYLDEAEEERQRKNRVKSWHKWYRKELLSD